MNETERTPSVPYWAYEGAITRCERIIKRLIIALIVSIIAIVATNAIWLYEWSQYDYTSDMSAETISIDSKDGIANYIGNDGSISNGTDTSSTHKKNTDATP